MAETNSNNEDDDNDSSFLAIDTLRIDNRSRVTLTNKVKDILPVRPGDAMAFYQDRSSGDIVLKVQRGLNIVESLKLTKKGTNTNSRKTESVFIQTDSRNSLDRINGLTTPHYFPNEPHRRYFPNIILIDDDPDILFTFQAYLSYEGFNVQIFSKSDEALKHLMSKSHEYRVVITDIRMPGVNGLEIYKKIKSVNEKIKVIFITALDAADEILSIFTDIKEGDIIRKPVERDEFVKRVKAAIFS